MKNARPELRRLVADLTCDDAIKCQKARRALVSMGEAAVDSLVNALHDKRHWVRWEAAKALSQIASPSSTQALIDTLEDKDFDLRWLAAEGLVRIGPIAIVPILKALFKQPESQWLREGAHHVFLDMELGPLVTVLKPVTDALDDPNPEVTLPIAVRKTLDVLEDRQ